MYFYLIIITPYLSKVWYCRFSFFLLVTKYLCTPYRHYCNFQGPLSQPSAAGLACGIQDFSSDRCSYLRFRAWASTLRCIHTVPSCTVHTTLADGICLGGVRGYFVIMVLQKSYDYEIETCHPPKPHCYLPKIPCPRTQIAMGMEGRRRRSFWTEWQAHGGVERTIWLVSSCWKAAASSV
jgi:hypothetical protein